MAKIWHFIGLPDPDEPADPSASKLDTASSRISQDETAEFSDQTELPIQVESWAGPMTPQGIPFHDLGDPSRRVRKPEGYISKRSLRYVTPNAMNQLPLTGMVNRLSEGDVLFVDLSVMVHMEAHQRACRQSLRHLSNDRRLPVFALDESESLLMLAGDEIHVDVTRHVLD